MLHLKDVRHVAKLLEHPVERVFKKLESPGIFYERLRLLDPQRPNKQRYVLSVNGELRLYQERLYRRLLLPKLRPSPYSYGGIRGKSIKDNAAQHVRSTDAFKTDICDFYPTISHQRVYRLFVEEFDCAPDVARLCTKICTYENHLALGLVTSPILADQVLQRVDRRIGIACQELNLVYTRWVDDIVISGRFDLADSGVRQLVVKVLRQNGFRINPAKDEVGKLSDGLAITKIRIRHGRFDVQKHYYDELERQLEAAKSLSQAGPFDGQYFTKQQIEGRVRFVCWVNPGRRNALWRKMRSVAWRRHEAEAKRRGYEVAVKELVKVPPIQEPVDEAARAIADVSCETLVHGSGDLL